MRQPTRNTHGKVEKKRPIRKYPHVRKRKHPEYGTSKLEERFARDFLDKLGLEYVYQYKMGSIGRYADFFIRGHNTIIEVDGDYYHAYGLLHEEMSPMQKRNKKVDEKKDRWCSMNGVKMIRIWEHDINKQPSKVMRMLKEAFGIIDRK